MKTGLLRTAAIVAAAAALAACSSASSSTSTSSTPAGTASSGATGEASGSSPSSSPTTMTTVTVGTSGATNAYGPIYVGAMQGIFTKHGINLVIQTLTPNSVTAAVLSGQVDIGMDGPNIASGILSNPSAKVVATPGPTVFYIYAHKDVKSIADLKGKTIAVTTPGGALDTSVRAALADAGLKAGTDVKIAYLQTNSAALAATETGSVQAAGVSPPTSIQAQQAGLVQVANITKFCPLGLIAASDKFLANTSAMTAFFAAWKEANVLATTNEADASAALQKYVKITDKAQLDGSWQAYKDVWEVGPFPADAMKGVLQVLAESTPPVKGAATADPNSLIDNTAVQAAG